MKKRQFPMVRVNVTNTQLKTKKIHGLSKFKISQYDDKMNNNNIDIYSSLIVENSKLHNLI